MSELFTIAAIGVGGMIVYKMLTIPFGEPSQVQFPKIPFFFGDDQMIFINGMHADNRVAPVEAKPVDKYSTVIAVNNALYEAPPENLTPRTIPPTKYTKRFV